MTRFPFPEAAGLLMIVVLSVLGGCSEPTPQELEARAKSRAEAYEYAEAARLRQEYSNKVLRSMRVARICGAAGEFNYIFVSFDGRLWMSSYQDVQGWGWDYIHPIAAGVTLKDVC